MDGLRDAWRTEEPSSRLDASERVVAPSGSLWRSGRWALAIGRDAAVGTLPPYFWYKVFIILGLGPDFGLVSAKVFILNRL